jgi:alanyl-tRNA synthetase
MDESHMIPQDGNFWEIGAGPCGPDTEIFFDRGEKYDPEGVGIELLVNEMENDRYVEIWNIVFSQFNSEPGKKREEYKELPSKNIDTGAGLERFACIIQGTDSNFETDLFWPVISTVETMTGKKYDDNHLAFRVIADHIRSITFALSDGEMFSNEGRGYVLRRLLRRAERYGRVLGMNEPFLYKFVDTVCEIMHEYYPYLEGKKEFVSKMIKSEEEKFIKTLSNGEQLLRKLVKDNSTLKAEDMFKLYDTFGFPKELTIEICEEYGVKVDMEGFLKLMEEQKERARAARSDAQSMNKQSKDLMEFVTPSTFTYGFESIETKVIGCFVNGEKVDSITSEGEVIFEESIFYAESGGQVADNGEIVNNETAAKVLNVIKAPNKQHLHSVTVLYGEIKVGDTFTLNLNKLRRLKIMRNHSSVHLLQAALTEVLGSHISQHGSYVSDELVHFDFSHFAKMSENELKEVEQKVNNWINEAIKGEVKVLPIEEAKTLGAKALFDEKYGDVVRVVCFGDVSKEFCGGTHVNNTQDIGVFAIEFEESVAAGVRRIQARTSLGAYELMKKREAILDNTKKILSLASYGEIIDRLKSVLNDRDSLKKSVETLTTKIGNALADSLKSEFVEFEGVNLLCAYLKGTKRDGLLAINDSLKQSVKDSIIILLGDDKDDSFPILISVNNEAIKLGYKAGLIMRKVASYLGGNGGGRPDTASGAGKDKNQIPSLLKNIKEIIK